LLASRFAPAPLPVPYFVLVSFPFTDLTSTKRRPALVVSPDSFNELNEDLILAAVTSQVTNSPHSVPVAPTDCQDGSLPKESFVELTKVFTISSALSPTRRETRRGLGQTSGVAFSTDIERPRDSVECSTAWRP
jgi:mRNA interferase MazF